MNERKKQNRINANRNSRQTGRGIDFDWVVRENGAALNLATNDKVHYLRNVNGFEENLCEWLGLIEWRSMRETNAVRSHLSSKLMRRNEK